MKSENQNTISEKRTVKGKKKSSLSYIFGGKVLTEEYIVKQSGLIFLIFFLVILFITNRYSCAKQLTEMDRLKKELIELRSEQVNLSYDLTLISGESQIEELLKKKRIDLKKGNATVVYQIKKD